MIQLNHVTRVYGTVIGVNDMTLTLSSGAHGLLGPNGAGKTTLLNLLTGQLRPTLGTVRVFGEDPRNNRRVLSRLGVCPGEEAMYANVSGWAWVRHLLELHGYDAHEAGERARDALGQAGMAEAMHRTIGTYSRGMRQRTKLAQALAHDPDLLVLDEPFNGLDPIGRHEVTGLLLDWVHRGKSLILASHLLHEVEAISHSCLFIAGGRLLASGTSEELNSLLTNGSRQVRIQCSSPRRLAERVWRSELVDEARIDADGTLVLKGSQPEEILRRLPGWVEETGATITELDCRDESLQGLFDDLMRLHRGEAP